jgi:hypothetical protein
MNGRCIALAVCLGFFVQACAGPKPPPEELLSLSEAQMKIRSYQTRVFDIESQDKVVRGVVAALQDLGFIIERANAPMGLVTAGKFDQGGFVALTVTVRPKGAGQNEVRVNALFNTQPIEDPKAYQNFFAAVERSLFISS